MSDLVEGIHQLPEGTYLPPEWGRSEDQDYCKAKRSTTPPNFTTYICWRRGGHLGRHATILNDGTVIARWGDDVHADVRGMSRPLHYPPDHDPTDQEMPAWGSLADSWSQSMRGRS